MHPAQTAASAPAGHRILYVGGYGRSGSTLLGRVLGQATNSICVGETCYLCTRGLVENVECGCGRAFRECEFWSAVGTEAYGGWENVDVGRLAEADRLASRYRTLPFQRSPRDQAELSAAAEHYVTWLGALFPAIARVSGATNIVETSKDPWFAALLTRIAGGDVRIVHLVRDSRAVAYSWTRSKQRPSPVGEESYMPRFRPGSAASRWMVANASFHYLAGRAAGYRRVGYERFVASPRETLAGLSGLADGSPATFEDQLADRRVRLGEHHIFSGNPMRSSTGWVELRIDDEWRAKLPGRDFAEVTAITLPLLKLYGYPVRRPAAPGRPS